MSDMADDLRTDLSGGVAYAWWVEALMDEIHWLSPCTPKCRYCASIRWEDL